MSWSYYPAMDPATPSGFSEAWDHISFYLRIPVFVLRFFALLFKNRKPLHWRQKLAVTFLIAQRESFTRTQLSRLARRTPTSAGIKSYCKGRKIAHRAVTLDGKTRWYEDREIPAPTLHFVTPACAEDASGTLVYFHGGGYANPMRAAGHMPFALRCARACRAKQVIFLEYALAPEHPYPAQLIQAVATLEHLLDQGLKPNDIILAGDSAGAHLIGSLLAHIVRPSPYADPIEIGDSQFKAVLLVGPMATLTQDQKSYVTNDSKDFLRRPQVERFMQMWAPTHGEVYADLFKGAGAEDIWPQVVPRQRGRGIVERIMGTIGQGEVLLDSCLAFSREYLRAEEVMFGRGTDPDVFKGKECVLAVCEGEVHVQPALDAAVGYEGGLMTVAIDTWLASL